jgi:hypothetical protein
LLKKNEKGEAMTSLTPAQYIVLVFGGVRKASREIGRSPSRVSAWLKRHGRIPSAAQLRILEIAKSRGLDITPKDLICGRRVERKVLGK